MPILDISSDVHARSISSAHAATPITVISRLDELIVSSVVRRRPRIAIGRVNQETNALSPLDTELADFERTHFLTGDAVLDVLAPRAHEVPGIFRNAELSGFARAARKLDAELVPLVSAWAIPGGPLSRACFESIVGSLTERIRRALPLDAVYLALHGAMGVRGLRDPEGEILRAVRDVVGPDMPVAATYDLHGNMTRARIERATFHCAYLTNPHRDHARTGARAARLLGATLDGRIRPVTAWRSLPMILGGGVQLDFWPPLRSVYAEMRALRRDRRVLDTSLFTVHPWNDDPELGWSVVVHADGDEALADRAAEKLADLCWSMRGELPLASQAPRKRSSRSADRASRGGSAASSSRTRPTSPARERRGKTSPCSRRCSRTRPT